MTEQTTNTQTGAIVSLQGAVKSFNGLEGTGRICGVTGRAVKFWLQRGKLPRTELTGETEYARKMAEANPDIDEKALLNEIKTGLSKAC